MVKSSTNSVETSLCGMKVHKRNFSTFYFQYFSSVSIEVLLPTFQKSVHMYDV